MVLAGSHIRVLGNRARVVDDFIQLGSNSDHVEIAHDRILGAGPSHHGKGDSRSPGTTWVHHNIVDTRHQVPWGKPDPDGLLRSNYHGWRGQRPFPAHTASALGQGDPWKAHHNTLVFDGTRSSTGSVIQLWYRRSGTGVAHEAYNNLLVEVSGGAFMKGLSLDAGPQAYAGTVYARPSDALDGPLFENIDGPDGNRNHAFLQAFRRPSDHAASMRWQPAGWTAGSIRAPVGLDADYRPGAGSAAARGAVSLPDDFPGPRSQWRGAIAPR